MLLPEGQENDEAIKAEITDCREMIKVVSYFSANLQLVETSEAGSIMEISHRGSSALHYDAIKTSDEILLRIQL